ncbi:MAG: hypothetical protein PHF50_03515 [Patescibacteria group bacterium]|nr:hypothetical protein [Patescibacteria group bacterium]
MNKQNIDSSSGEKKQLKGCFLLQRSFAPVGHAMAYVFTKKYNVASHCGFTSVRKNYDYLLSQNDVKYTELLFDEDLHAQYKNEIVDFSYLKMLEQEYGLPNLWPYLTVDRILLHGQFLRQYPYDQPIFNHMDLLKILQATAKKIIAFLETEKPDFVFFPTVGSLGTFLLLGIAKKKNIPVFSGEFPRFRNLYMITEDPRDFSSLNEQFLKLKNKEISPSPEITSRAEALLLEYIDHPAPYDETATPEQQPISRFKQMKFLLPSGAYWSIRCFIKTIKDYYSSEQKNDYMRVNPWFYLYDSLKKKIRILIGYDDLYDAMDDNDDFVFFPLSVEPELSLLFCAPFATDQINIIKQLAQSLPINYKLYVKEHPHMFGFRARKFYREIKKMPNVKLINPGINSYAIIKKAKMVASINGTAGWEALLFKKPAITFGAAFYNSLSMVKYCASMPDLPKLVKEQLENFHFDRQELFYFIAAVLENSAPVDIIHLWQYRSQWPDIKKMAQEVEPLVDLLAKKLNIIPKTGQ